MLNQLLKLCKHTVLSLIFKSLTPEKPELEGRTKIPVKLLGVIKNTFFFQYELLLIRATSRNRKLDTFWVSFYILVQNMSMFLVWKSVSYIEEGNLGQKIMLDMKLILTEKMRGWQTHSKHGIVNGLLYRKEWKWNVFHLSQFVNDK